MKYKYFIWSNQAYYSPEKILNKIGEQGWKLFQVSGHVECPQYIFEKSYEDIIPENPSL